MQSNEQTTSKESKLQKRGINLELFYYEQVGSHYYFRFTRFALVLIVGLTIVSIIMMLAFFLLSNYSSTQEKVNVNITTPKLSSTPDQIIQPTPAPQPKPNKPPKINILAPSSSSLPKIEGTTHNAPANRATQAQSNRSNNEE